MKYMIMEMKHYAETPLMVIVNHGADFSIDLKFAPEDAIKFGSDVILQAEKMLAVSRAETRAQELASAVLRIVARSDASLAIAA